MPVAHNDLVEVSLAAISGPQREMNRKVLQPVLTNLIAYGRILKQLHWNVTGPHFRAVHLHLDEIYDEVDEAIDRVAERLSAVGHSPDGRIPTVMADAELEHIPEGFLRDSEVLLLAEHRTKQVVETTRSRMAQIEEEDTVTADLLHQICATFEKHHWMLQAQRI